MGTEPGAAMNLKLVGRFRWWIARRLDKRPGTCWADLVCWTLWHETFMPPRGVCRDNIQENDGWCYCGKNKP
jgi:hypothetical protein